MQTVSFFLCNLHFAVFREAEIARGGIGMPKIMSLGACYFLSLFCNAPHTAYIRVLNLSKDHNYFILTLEFASSIFAYSPSLRRRLAASYIIDCCKTIHCILMYVSTVSQCTIYQLNSVLNSLDQFDAKCDIFVV